MKLFAHRISPLRAYPQLFFGAAGLALLIGLLSAFGFSQTIPQTAHRSSLTIRENGYFRADLGYFFLENGRLDVYDSALDSGLIWDNVMGRYVSVRDTERELSQKAKPFYHEVFQLARGDWTRTEREFAQQPTRYLDFAPCDARDQLDLPDDPAAGLDASMRKVFARGIKVKGIAEFGGGRFAVVAFSEPPKEPPPIYEPGIYTLRVLLLWRSNEGWNAAGNLEAERGAYYCGMRSLQTTLEDGGTAVVALLYSSAPQGSRIVSVERQIRSFLIRPEAGEPSRSK